MPTKPKIKPIQELSEDDWQMRHRRGTSASLWPDKFREGIWNRNEVGQWCDSLRRLKSELLLLPSVWVELCFLVGLDECLSYAEVLFDVDNNKEWREWFADFSVELKEEYDKCIDAGFSKRSPLPVSLGTKENKKQPQSRSNKMAKSKSFLSGVSKEARSKLTALRNEARKVAAAEKEKENEKYKDGLYKVRTAFLRAMEDAKKAGEIPKTTTIDKIGKLPKSVPSRWSTTYKRLFGRKSPLGKPAAEKPAEKTAPKKKARSKAKSKK